MCDVWFVGVCSCEASCTNLVHLCIHAQRIEFNKAADADPQIHNNLISNLYVSFV